MKWEMRGMRRMTEAVLLAVQAMEISFRTSLLTSRHHITSKVLRRSPNDL